MCCEQQALISPRSDRQHEKTSRTQGPQFLFCLITQPADTSPCSADGSRPSTTCRRGSALPRSWHKGDPRDQTRQCERFAARFSTPCSPRLPPLHLSAPNLRSSAGHCCADHASDGPAPQPATELNPSRVASPSSSSSPPCFCAVCFLLLQWPPVQQVPFAALRLPSTFAVQLKRTAAAAAREGKNNGRIAPSSQCALRHSDRQNCGRTADLR